MRAATVFLLLLTGCAAPAGVAGNNGAAGRTSGTALGTVEALPAELAGFRRVPPVIDYDRDAPGRGLGASVRYEPANGEHMRATVYLYDRGQVRQPEGAGSPDVAEELRLAVAEVGASVRAGLYRAVRPGAGMTGGQPSDPGSVRCVTFQVVQRDGSPTADAACVAVNRGRFVKVRVTAWDLPDPAAAGVVAAGLLSQVERAQAGEGTPAGMRL